MEMAMTMCVLSAILYWTVIYQDMRNVYKWDNVYDRQFLMFLTCLHLLPLISVAINYLLSDVEFLKRDITAIIMLGLLYMLVNFVVSKVAGWHIYPFLTWLDIRSFITATLFILLLVGIYIVLVILTSLIPRKNEPTVDQRLM